MGVCLGARPQQRQKRTAKSQHRRGEYGSGEQRHIKTEGTHSPDGIVPPSAQKTGDQGAPALTEDIAYGHEGVEKRSAQRHSRNQKRVVGPGDKVGIREIVYQRDHHAEHDRQSQPEIGWDQAVRIEKSALFHSAVWSFR